MKKSLLPNYLLLFFIIASVYHPRFHGRNMSNGKPYNHYKNYTVAYNKYPLGTKIEITYRDKKIKAEVTDRIGVKGRIDLSGKLMKDLYGFRCDYDDVRGCTLILAKVRVISDAEYYEEQTSELKRFFWFLF
jgi:hypothetical protein